MENLACYTSYGRIRELIIFDPDKFKLPDGPASTAKYRQIIDRYKPVQQHMRHDSKSPVRIIVMFRANKPSGTWQEGQLFLVPVNGVVSNSNLPTRWVQDIIHIIPRGSFTTFMLNAERVSGKLFKVFDETLSEYDWQLQRFKTLPTGGNLIRLKSGRKDVGFEGQNILNPKPGSFAYSAAQLNLDKSDYNFLSWENSIARDCPQLLQRILFHADQYLMPVGNVKRGRNFLFLVPRLILAKFSEKEINSCVDTLNRKFETFSGDLRRLLGKRAICESLPLYVISLTHEPFGLCYNNCLVENFEESGRQVIRIYFPDFRKSTASYLERVARPLENDATGGGELFISGEIMKNLSAIAGDVNLTEGLISDSQAPLQDVIELTNKIIAKTHNDLRKMFRQKWNIEPGNIHFISMDFRDDAQRLGGLHCRMKVIRRDLP